MKFTVKQMNPIPETSYPALIDLINETYTDRVEQILGAGVDDNGNIFCAAQDGDKKLAIEITDTGIQIKLFNPNPTAQFTAPKPDIPTQIADNLQTKANPIAFGWLKQIEQIFNTTDDLASAREALFQLYPQLDSSELKEQMTDALALASMTGFESAQTDAND
jgi:phage gp29-like protein